MKNFLFICGSLHLGRDGVGDYTQRLAAALEQRGCECRMISWSEKMIKSPLVEGNCLRLPEGLPLRAKWGQVRHFLEDFSPDWVSLQFVPYSFSHRGLPAGFGEEIAPVIGKTPLHIFAHELWVMACMGCSMKDRLMGETLQKNIVLGLFKKLAPKVIHVAVPLYAQRLQAAGFSPRLLPLFGNIPVRPIKTPLPRDPAGRVLGFFGSIHPSVDFDKVAAHLADLGQRASLKITLRNSGMLAESAKRAWRKAQKKWSDKIDFESFGYISPSEASWYLQSLDWGLSTYSPVFWSKGSTVASMREHGIPVCLWGVAERAGVEELPKGVYTSINESSLITPPTPAHPVTVESVAEQFLNDLNTYV